MLITSRLIYIGRRRGFRRVSKELLALYGVEVPAQVEIGVGLEVVHRGFGLVVHQDTTIGNPVRLHHGVTFGRAVPWEPNRGERIVVGDDVIVCAGAKVLCGLGETLTVGRGSIIGANAVLTRSTGSWEIWAGVPATLRGSRDPIGHNSPFLVNQSTSG